MERLVAGAGIALKHAGKDLLGRCSFHEDAEAPLVVTPSKNLWHCFGSQQGGGPIGLNNAASRRCRCATQWRHLTIAILYRLASNHPVEPLPGFG